MIRELQSRVSYGWGMIPVSARIGNTRSSTAMWIKEGPYVLPIKVAVRRAEGIDESDTVTASLEISAGPQEM